VPFFSPFPQGAGRNAEVSGDVLKRHEVVGVLHAVLQQKGGIVDRDGLDRGFWCAAELDLKRVGGLEAPAGVEKYVVMLPLPSLRTGR
jgi:hypothetical protein